MNAKRNLVGLAVAAALGMPVAAHADPAVVFDQNGSAGGGLVIISELGWSNGNAVLDNIIEAPQAGWLYAQTHLTGLDNNGTPVGLGTDFSFTYQVRLPVTSTQADGDTVQLSNDTTRVGYFRMFADSSNSKNFLTGAGFGDNNSCTGNTGNVTPTGAGCTMSTGQIIILEGEVRMRGTMNVNQDNLVDLAALGTNNGTDVGTAELSAGTDLDIFITSVNTDFWSPLMVGTTMDIDLTVDTLGFTVPFNVAVSDSVVGVTPFFGDPETVTWNASSALSTTTTVPMNDLACASGTATTTNTSPCDIQMQTSGNSHFTRDIPEPGSLALLGAGLLGLAGLARRRKLRQG
jgi:hypothetical protein